MTLDIAASKKRLFIMLGVVGACMVAALVSLLLAVRFDTPGALGAFVAALLAGFAAQLWFLFAFLRGRRS